jgi:hypothetical protein
LFKFEICSHFKIFTFKNCSVSKKFLNLKSSDLKLLELLIIIHFRKNKKEKKKEKRKRENTWDWAVPVAAHEARLCGRAFFASARRRRLGASSLLIALKFRFLQKYSTPRHTLENFRVSPIGWLMQADLLCLPAAQREIYLFLGYYWAKAGCAR